VYHIESCPKIVILSPMIETLLSILFVYIFIVLGFLAKQLFKEELDTKTLTLFSVYFLQPFVALWGFSTATLHTSHLYAPLWYMVAIALLLLPTLFLGHLLFVDRKERAIFNIAGFVGNTGNLGIPLGIALFGMESIIYTTLINLANVLVVYVLGVYIYSRGSFSIKASLFNIVKIPIIPASLVAILININHITLHPHIEELLKMGAYAGIVLQLFLLGTFLSKTTSHHINLKLYAFVLSQKFIFIPLLTLLILNFTSLPPMVQAILFMEMMMPLAVANINLASLYNCKPQEVSQLILLSTLLFIPLLFILTGVITHYFGI
jgi:predicted permease